MDCENLITGSLAVFYPCRIKNTSRIKRALSLWKKRRQRQLRQLHNSRLPLTDLMDAEWVRDEMDDVLSNVIPNWDCYAPYATRCIQEEYRESREGKQHSKETNIVLSRFRMAMPEQKNNKINVDGLLIFSLNLDNLVGTFIINLNFKKLKVGDVIFLKHVFYKRYVVAINHLNSEGQLQNNNYFHCEIIDQNQFQNITIPEYVIAQSLHLWKGIKWSIDFRARYSLLEVDTCVCRRIAYGLLMADEGYEFVPSHVIRQLFIGANNLPLDLSTRRNYSYYVSGQNGIIIKRKSYKSLRQNANNFFMRGIRQNHHHQYYPPELRTGIAGIGKGRFKTFLKAVELHYLVNTATTNEIEVRQQSHINPLVFIKRAYRLWEIIYELDMNPYHRDDVIIERFGITNKIAELKEEYKSILNLAIGYATVFIAVFTLIFTIAQLCR